MTGQIYFHRGGSGEDFIMVDVRFQDGTALVKGGAVL